MKFSTAACFALLVPLAAAAQPRPFCIHVQQRDAGTPIAGARLETTGRIVLTTDVNGNAAFYEPGLMERDVFFHVTHPAFEHAKDGFGYQGRALRTAEGAGGTLELVPSGPPVAGRTDDEDTRLCARTVPGPGERFRIRAVDDATGLGVPLVQVGDRVTDSDGYIAFYERAAFGAPQRFTVFSHGYTFGDGGVTLTPTPGGSAELRLTRQNVAERRYRVTGGGIYADSVLLGLRDAGASVLNAGVIGQDSVLSAVYRGEPFFIWGDTNRAAYPLGTFESPGARGTPSALRYFENDAGFVRGLAPIPGPGGPVWLSGLAVVHGDAGDELWASYAKIISLGETAHVGLVKWSDARETFEQELRWSDGGNAVLDGHPFEWQRDDGPWLEYRFGARVPATPQALRDPAQYVLVAAAGARWTSAVDVETGKPITLHSNDAIAWNAHRGRFLRFTTRAYGDTSFLGEVYLQEGDTPLGPWVWARRVLEHRQYTFYNPRHHPFMDEDGGAVVWFEGTYTDSFSGNTGAATPRYDYNQVMYRLALDDERVRALPVPVYLTAGGRWATKRDLPPGSPPLAPSFYGWDRALDGGVPVGLAAGPCTSPARLVRDPPGAPLFWALASADDAGFRTLDAPALGAFPVDDYSAPLKVWAGSDRCVTQQTPDGGYVAQLSANGSRYRGSSIARYQWAGLFGTAEGESVTVVLPAGLHEVTLTATGVDGTIARDAVLLEAGSAVILEPPPEGCGCQCSSAGGLVFAALGALALRRRSRK